MENFYDYKKVKYEIKDYVGENDWKLFLLRNNKGEYYIFDTTNTELVNSAKPLRSVFNRYDAKTMYNIPKFAQQITDADILSYEERKCAVIAYDLTKKQQSELAQKIEEAKRNGWEEINTQDVQFAITDSGLEIIADGNHFNIKTRSEQLDFNKMTETEIDNYIKSWVLSYNNTVGDLSQAQTTAECSVLAERTVAKWTNEDKNNSEWLTTQLVTNLDITDKFSGYQSDKAFALAQKIITYMEEHSIPFTSSDTLMGDCSELPYDIYAVMIRHQSYNENFREEALAKDIETKALKYLKDKHVLPLNAATDEKKNYSETINIPNPDNIDLRACKYLNNVIGAESYDILLSSKYPYFDVRPRIIGSCTQQTLNTLLNSSESTTTPRKYKSLNTTPTAAKGKSNANNAKANKQWQM